MSYQSTKTFGHEVGLSCCFRQWKATSHCRFLHGYALGVKLTFSATELDERNWVMDFGGLKQVKQMLESMFDHKLLVAHDDPWLKMFQGLSVSGLAQVEVVDHTGCEAFAELVYNNVASWMQTMKYSPRVQLVSVEVCEHGANSATYIGQ